MRKAYFISFEGPDGSGKTSISKAIYQKLNQQGYPVVYTREPGGIDIAEKIRAITLDPENTAMDVVTEALLFAASRRQHFVEKIQPALNQGMIVLCDRFVDSSLAYQGIARKIGFDEVLEINRLAINNRFPDKTLYFDIDAKKGLERIKNRNFLDRLDQESLAFHEAVVSGYQEVIKHFGNRIIKIDASRSYNEVFKDAYTTVLELIEDGD